MITPNKIFILWRKRECSNLYFVDLRDDTNEKQLKAYAKRSQIQVYCKRKNFSKIFLADSQIDGRATRFNNRDQLWKNKKW